MFMQRPPGHALHDRALGHHVRPRDPQSPLEVSTQIFDLASLPDELPYRYNVAPRQPIPVIRRPRQLELLRWGLDMPDPKMAGSNAGGVADSAHLQGEGQGETLPRDCRRLLRVEGRRRGSWPRFMDGCPSCSRRDLRTIDRPEREGCTRDPRHHRRQEALVAFPVSRDVNNVRNDNGKLIEGVAVPANDVPKGKTLILF